MRKGHWYPTPPHPKKKEKNNGLFWFIMILPITWWLEAPNIWTSSNRRCLQLTNGESQADELSWSHALLQIVPFPGPLCAGAIIPLPWARGKQNCPLKWPTKIYVVPSRDAVLWVLILMIKGLMVARSIPAHSKPNGPSPGYVASAKGGASRSTFRRTMNPNNHLLGGVEPVEPVEPKR